MKMFLYASAIDIWEKYVLISAYLIAGNAVAAVETYVRPLIFRKCYAEREEIALGRLNGGEIFFFMAIKLTWVREFDERSKKRVEIPRKIW